MGPSPRRTGGISPARHLPVCGIAATLRNSWARGDHCTVVPASQGRGSQLCRKHLCETVRGATQGEPSFTPLASAFTPLRGLYTTWLSPVWVMASRHATSTTGALATTHPEGAGDGSGKGTEQHSRLWQMLGRLASCSTERQFVHDSRGK
jgi:hypothetical protein